MLQPWGGNGGGLWRRGLSAELASVARTPLSFSASPGGQVVLSQVEIGFRCFFPDSGIEQEKWQFCVSMSFQCCSDDRDSDLV